MENDKKSLDQLHINKETINDAHSKEIERVPEALGRNVDTLPISYFYSPKFIG